MTTTYKYRMVTNESASKELGKLEWDVEARSANDVLTLVWRDAIEKDSQLKNINKENWRNYFSIQIDVGGKWQKVQKQISFNTEPVGTIIGSKMMKEDIQKSIEAAQKKADDAANAGTTIQQPQKQEAAPEKNEPPAPFFTKDGKFAEWNERYQTIALKKKKLQDDIALKEANDRLPDRQNLEKLYNDKKAAWNNVEKGNYFAIGNAILKELGFGIQYLGTYLSYIPKDLRDGLDMLSFDLTLISLTVERLINIMESLWEIVMKLNSVGALDVIERYVKSVNKTLDEGIKYGILNKDGTLKPGFSKFAVAGVHGVNSAEDINKLLTIKQIINNPLFGGELKKALETEMLIDYERRTGVGFPDDNSMIKWVLGNSGAFMPIQEASEIAGNIPEWWLIGKAHRISKEIKENERKELERHRKDFKEREAKRKKRANAVRNGNPWVKR